MCTIVSIYEYLKSGWVKCCRIWENLWVHMYRTWCCPYLPFFWNVVIYIHTAWHFATLWNLIWTQPSIGANHDMSTLKIGTSKHENVHVWIFIFLLMSTTSIRNSIMSQALHCNWNILLEYFSIDPSTHLEHQIQIYLEKITTKQSNSRPNIICNLVIHWGMGFIDSNLNANSQCLWMII
jgi:hypothetical protein